MSDLSKNTITLAAAADAVSSTPWAVISDKLVVAYQTGSMVRGGEFVAEIIDAAEAAGHHPDIDLRYPSVHLVLTTHSAHGLTEADVDLAKTIAGIAADMGFEATERPVAQFDLAIDAIDIAAVRPFWKAVLGYSDAADHQPIDLVDPAGRLTGIWFQQMDSKRPQRNRLHVDLLLPPEDIAGRMQAALDAGGRLLSDTYAPQFWVLGDPEGNEICLCTWQGRNL